MSIKTWKKEFYPIDADVSIGNAVMAIDHSLWKWIGLRKKNLEKHSIEQDGLYLNGGVFDDEQFEISGGTCALCAYIDRGIHDDRCDGCPIKNNIQSNCFDEYEHYEETGDPELMIKLLAKVLDKEINK